MQVQQTAVKYDLDISAMLFTDFMLHPSSLIQYLLLGKGNTFGKQMLCVMVMYIKRLLNMS